MILDKVENAPLYYGISPDVDLCLKYLVEKQYPLVPTSRFSISPSVSFNVTQYTPKALHERSWEAHDRSIDIQVVMAGRESISYANRDNLTYTHTQEGKDHLCYEGEGSVLPLCEGYFCILFPDDVHRTKTILDSTEPVTKGVFKVAFSNR